jgi:hypothetical protein
VGAVSLQTILAMPDWIGSGRLSLAVFLKESAMARWKVAARLADELERRWQYRGSLIERHPDGSMGGVDSRKLGRALLERVHPPAPLLDVIREKCLDCCCCQPSEVDRCTAVGCSLWPYRFGTNPFSNRKGNPASLLHLKGVRQHRAHLAESG